MMQTEARLTGNSPAVIALGEVLWDCFPDGARFGGAPANYSCSLAELMASGSVRLLSAVGDDEQGHAAVQELLSHGVETSLLQHSSHPTGQVFVQTDSKGIASYQFAEHSAWDALQWHPELEPAARECDAVCFGTLGQRKPESAEVIRRFVAETDSGCLRILDLNLRAPWFDEDVIAASLELCNVLKVNEEELCSLAAMYGFVGSAEDQLQQFCSHLRLRCMAVTQGDSGAALSDGSLFCSCPALPVVVRDTVGAGDAFAAAMTLGLLHQEPLQTILESATQAAAFVCTQSGGTPHFPHV